MFLLFLKSVLQSANGPSIWVLPNVSTLLQNEKHDKDKLGLKFNYFHHTVLLLILFATNAEHPAKKTAICLERHDSRP